MAEALVPTLDRLSPLFGEERLSRNCPHRNEGLASLLLSGPLAEPMLHALVGLTESGLTESVTAGLDAQAEACLAVIAEHCPWPLEQAERLVRGMSARLSDRAVGARLAAAGALRAFNVQAIWALADLMESAVGRCPQTAVAAVRALTALGPAAESAEPMLRELATGRQPELAAAAQAALPRTVGYSPTELAERRDSHDGEDGAFQPDPNWHEPTVLSADAAEFGETLPLWTDARPRADWSAMSAADDDQIQDFTDWLDGEGVPWLRRDDPVSSRVLISAPTCWKMYVLEEEYDDYWEPEELDHCLATYGNIPLDTTRADWLRATHRAELSEAALIDETDADENTPDQAEPEEMSWDDWALRCDGGEPLEPPEPLTLPDGQQLPEPL